MLNRRHHKRLTNIKSAISVKYKYGLKFYKKDALCVTDISGGGIKLCLPNKLKSGTIVDMDIKLADLSESLAAKGEVTWSKEIESKTHPTPYFEAGIIFTKIDPLSVCKIYTYFQDHNLPIELT